MVLFARVPSQGVDRQNDEVDELLSKDSEEDR